MASFNFTSVVLDEGTTFTFDSWVYITDGSGGFNSHLGNPRELEVPTTTQHNHLDKFVDNLDEMLLPDLAGEIEEQSVFNATSIMLHQDSLDQIQSGLRNSVPDSPSGCAMRPLYIRRPCGSSPSPHWRRTWIAY
jgi:hypothetical protein